MQKSTLARTRSHVGLFVGATLAISGLVVWGARKLTPEHTVEASSQSAASTPRLTSEATSESAPLPETAPRRQQPIETAPRENDEDSLMRELREIKKRDPKRAVALAREGNRRFPNGEAAAERASIAIHSLTALGLTAEARGEAEDMVNRYPDNQWVREIEQFTGAHRHRNVRVNAEGKLEYYDPAPDEG